MNDDIPTGTPLAMACKAKPRNPRARFPCATVTVTYFVPGDTAPSPTVMNDLANAYLQRKKDP